MQSVKWHAFAVSNSITKTLLHFFPTANATNAPYPVNVKLNLLMRDQPVRSVAIDGGRLGQPDGLRLEDAFPSLAEGYQGYLGLSLEISTSQPRVDLTSSSCILEIISSAQTVKFVPKIGAIKDSVLKDTSGEGKYSTFAAMQDAYCTTSLLTCNYGDSIFQPILHSFSDDSSEVSLQNLRSEPVMPGAIQEHNFNEMLFTATEPQELAWGLSRNKLFYLNRDHSSDISFFVLYKDNVTKRIISVLPL